MREHVLSRVFSALVRTHNIQRACSSQGSKAYDFLRSYATYQMQTSLKRLQTRASLLAAGAPKHPIAVAYPAVTAAASPSTLQRPDLCARDETVTGMVPSRWNVGLGQMTTQADCNPDARMPSFSLLDETLVRSVVFGT